MVCFVLNFWRNNFTFILTFYAQTTGLKAEYDCVCVCVCVCSEAVCWWIEVDATSEECIRPLSEWGLLSEVLLHSWEVLCFHEVMEALVCGAEVCLSLTLIIVITTCIAAFYVFRRFYHLGLVGCTGIRLSSTLQYKCCVSSLIQRRQAAESITADWARDRVRLPVSGDLVARAHH